MIYELTDTSKVKPIFEGWNETLIYSCLQKVMGEIFVTDPDFPVSAMAYVGCFAFYAGVPDKELVIAKPEGFVIMTPQNKEWEACIEACFPAAKKVTRYAIKKDTQFDLSILRSIVKKLPEGYVLKEIDNETYDLCLTDPVTWDFVSSFESKEKYLKIGRGMVVMKYREEMLANEDSFDGCAGLEDVGSFDEWIDFDARMQKKYGKGYVPSEVFLAVRANDDKVVGIIDYRHPLSPFLMKYGGNIGYSVLPSERRKGYAGEMLKLLLSICREYGEKQVLLTCDKDNDASRLIQSGD